MNIIIVEEIKQGYKPSKLTTAVSDSVTLKIDTYIFYESSRVLAICEDSYSARKIINKHKRIIKKEFGSESLKEPPTKDKDYYSFRTTSSETIKEDPYQ